MFWSLLVACTPDLTPAWAWDPIWLEPRATAVSGSGSGGALPLPGSPSNGEPRGEEAVHGFQTWQIYGPKWEAHAEERFYVCAVVVELEGEPVACDTEDCESAWSITPTPVETDCAGDLAEDPLFLSIRVLAMGGPVPEEEAAWPGLTSVGWADYGDGWQRHGQAYTEALDHGGAGQLGWNGSDAVLFVPEAAVPLAP